MFGSSSLFGTPSSTPAFGNPSSTPAFGTPSSTPAFGAPSSTPAFGTPSSTPAFGTPSSTPAFGTPSSTPAFGTPSSTPAFGTPSSTPAFGLSSTLTFGTPSSTPAFGTPSSTPAFGAPSSTPAFGATPSPSPFGFQPQATPSPIGFAGGGGGQITTQMAPVAPLPLSPSDRDIQAIVDAYKEDPGNPRYAFRHLLFSVTEPSQRVKPVAASDIMWAEAMGKLECMDSADRERLWPQLVQGFKDLSCRLKLQDEVLASDTERLSMTRSNVKKHGQSNSHIWRLQSSMDPLACAQSDPVNYAMGAQVYREDVEIVPPPTTRRGKERKVSRRGGGFTKPEDEVLCSAFLNVGKDPITGVNQTQGGYYKRLHDYYNNHKPEGSNRSQLAIQHRWSTIQRSVNKFCGFKSAVDRRNESGKNEQDRIEDAVKMYEAAEPFQFMHCWKILRNEAKWNDKLLELNSHSASTGGRGFSQEDLEPVAVPEEVNLSNPLARPEGRDSAKRKRATEASSSSSAVDVLHRIHENREKCQQKEDEQML
ncbi:hypothetical protein ACP70R_023217 [Stipagrostis hirtigluma subsp. patula]